jgi:hypothetical protein
LGFVWYIEVKEFSFLLEEEIAISLDDELDYKKIKSALDKLLKSDTFVNTLVLYSSISENL